MGGRDTIIPVRLVVRVEASSQPHEDRRAEGAGPHSFAEAGESDDAYAERDEPHDAA